MTTYRIRPGDTLSELAHRFGSSVSELARLNGIADPNLIIAGKTLRLPDEFSRGLGRGLLRPEGTRPAAKGKPAHAKPPAPEAPKARPSEAPKARPQAAAHAVAGKTPKGIEAQYEHFKDLIKSSGGKFRTGANQMNLLGLRQDTNTHANGGAGRYDDRLVMLWKDAQGKPHVKLFKYNTEPASDMARYAADVNHDRRADLGRIPSGYFEYGLSSWKHGFCLRAKGDFRVERDMDHDGRFDDRTRTSGGASMLFHEGGSSGTYSAGCQTFPPDEWRRFVQDVRHARGTIGYTLVHG